MGALPTLYAATQDLPGDSYVGPGGLLEMRGHPELVGRSGAARDDADGARSCGSCPSGSRTSRFGLARDARWRSR